MQLGYASFQSMIRHKMDHPLLFLFSTATSIKLAFNFLIESFFKRRRAHLSEAVLQFGLGNGSALTELICFLKI